MVSAARALASGSHRRRVAHHNAARSRRDSLRGFPKIHQTRLLDRDLTPLPISEVFPTGATTSPVTFQLRYRLSGTPDGTILNLGNGDPATTVYYDSGVLRAISGSGSVGSSAVTAVATRPHSAGARIRLVVAIVPGNGHLRIWDRHGLLAQGEAAGGPIPGWAEMAVVDDAIRTYTDPGGAANGLIVNPGAAVNIAPAAPSRAYAFHVPQHLLSDIPDFVPPSVFDEFLFRATFVNAQIALYPLADDSDDVD